MKNICVVIGSRANYSSIKSAMAAIKHHAALNLQIVSFASSILDRYGCVADLIEGDGFTIDAKIYNLIEGETPLTMAKSTGLGLIELPTVFERLKPDIVLTVGDRFETMATTLAAAYMNIAVAHTMGGEVTGTIDESIRHAITKFAHIHFPASNEAAERILKLGERSDSIFMVGCPRIDLVAESLSNQINVDEMSTLLSDGVGAVVDPSKPFLLVSQHPITTEYGLGERQITATLDAVRKMNMPSIILWPNSDAGSEDISRGMRKWREKNGSNNMHFYKNLPTNTYIWLMRYTACLIGNSSSGIREGAYIGTPCVNIGTRQTMRQRGANVLDCYDELNSLAIYEAIKKQVEHGCYTMDPVYGDGSAGNKIANILSSVDYKIQKRITY